MKLCYYCLLKCLDILPFGLLALMLNDTTMACSLEKWLLTARLLCRMAVAIDSFSASVRLDFSQCVTKMDLSRVGPILLPVWHSRMPSMYAVQALPV